MVLRQPTEIGQGLASLSAAAMMFQPSGGEGHEDHAGAESQSGDQLQTERNEPSRVLLFAKRRSTNVICAVIDPETDQDAGSDS